MAAAAFATAPTRLPFLAAARRKIPSPNLNPGSRRRLKTLTLVASSPPPRRNPSRRFSNAAPRVAGTDPKIVNGDEDNQSRETPPMKSLIALYKKAFLDGDEKFLSEVEAAILALESDKNSMSAKFAEMSAEIISGKDKFLRLNADFDNFRKQTEKDRVKFTSNIQEEVVESLLPIVDCFEKAKQEITPETEKEKKIDTSYQGIYKQLVEVLRSLGVGVVETVGKPFDPAIHEAIAREESPQLKAGIVSQEIRRGFLLKGRILRPATVKVSTGPGHRNTSSAPEKPEEDNTASATTGSTS